jgi:2-amino-4-hydroxy-6-hydroxymethyldihydropteridine diphosphokinase
MSEPANPSRAFIAVGSNIDPQSNLPDALRALREVMVVSAVSTCYHTVPVGPADQPTFVNGVWLVAEPPSPDTLKHLCRQVEHQLGRRRSADRYAPRPVDLDLVYRDDTPDALDADLARPFVCIPLLEIAPDLSHGPIGQFARQAGPPGEPMPELTRRLRCVLIE